jgi:hypothetical protein
MGNPFDTKEGLSLLDLDNLLAYRAGKLPSSPHGYNPIP